MINQAPGKRSPRARAALVTEGDHRETAKWFGICGLALSLPGSAIKLGNYSQLLNLQKSPKNKNKKQTNKQKTQRQICPPQKLVTSSVRPGRNLTRRQPSMSRCCVQAVGLRATIQVDAVATCPFPGEEWTGGHLWGVIGRAPAHRECSAPAAAGEISTILSLSP